MTLPSCWSFAAARFRKSKSYKWADELLKLLEYLHTREPPIIHRDIKPANLKVTSQGEVFLLDFGLAKGAAGQMATTLGPLYAIFVIVVLSLPAARNWARSDTQVASVPGAKWNVLAIVSMICALIPLVFSQGAALGLGIAALLQIKKSDGALRGKGFAIGGIVISIALFLFLAAVLIAGFLLEWKR